MSAITANHESKIVDTTLTQKRAQLKKEESTIHKLRIAEIAIRSFAVALAIASIPAIVVPLILIPNPVTPFTALIAKAAFAALLGAGIGIALLVKHRYEKPAEQRAESLRREITALENQLTKL